MISAPIPCTFQCARWLLVAWLVAGCLPLCAPHASALDFIAGADYSHLVFFEQRGIVYRDAGQPRDALAILKDRGVTCARLRLFTSCAALAAADPYNYINNLDYTLPLALRVKNAGLKFMLDFHYSDSWADPGKQTKPAAWTNLSFVELKDQMRAYNSNTIAVLKAAGAMPEYVQVGNEIISGLLWPDGRVGGSYDTPAQWSKLAQLLTNAIAGIRDAAGDQMPAIMIHIDRGGDWAGTQWFFDRLLQQQVPFDLIGLSYYPFWHGNFDALSNCLHNTALRYSKPVVIAETAFPWTGSGEINGLPATPEGQVQFVTRLAQIVRNLPGGRGAGIFWWGTEYQRTAGYSLAGFDQRSFYELGGNVLPVATAFGNLVAPLRLTIQPNGAGALLLSWPLSGAGTSLVTATSPLPPAPWLPATNLVQATGGAFNTSVTVTTNDNRFFRLRSN